MQRLRDPLYWHQRRFAGGQRMSRSTDRMTNVEGEGRSGILRCYQYTGKYWQATHQDCNDECAGDQRKSRTTV